MRHFFFFALLMVLVSCGRVEVHQEKNTLRFRFPKGEVVLLFPKEVTSSDVAFYTEAFRRFFRLEPNPSSGVIEITEERYVDFFQMGNVMLKNWKNLTLRWAWIAQVWEGMRWQAIKSQAAWAIPLQGEMMSYCRVRDFENFFQKYQLTPQDLRQTRQYLVQFLIVEVYFVSLQELMERYARYYSLTELPAVFFQVVVLPESVEWLEFLQRRYGNGKIRDLARMSYDKQQWERKLGKPVSDLESEFVRGRERLTFDRGIWRNLDFVHEYQNLLTLYNTSTKPTLFKK